MPPAQTALTFTGSSLVVLDLTDVPVGHSVTRLVATALQRHHIISQPNKNSIIEFSFMSPGSGKVHYAGAHAALYEYPTVAGEPGAVEIFLKNSEARTCAIRADCNEVIYWVTVKQTDLLKGPPTSFEFRECFDDFTLLSQKRRSCPRPPHPFVMTGNKNFSDETPDQEMGDVQDPPTDQGPSADRQQREPALCHILMPRGLGA